MHDIISAPLAEAPQISAAVPTFEYEVMHSAVEEIYELRTVVIRVGLLGLRLSRPDPLRDTPQSEIDDLSELIRQQADFFASVTSMLVDGTPHNDVKGDICSFIHSTVSEKPEALRKIREIDIATKMVVKEVLAKTTQRSAVLDAHMIECDDGFHEVIIGLCEHIWVRHLAAQTAELENGRKAAEQLQNRLHRLARIGTHVRLVSLNASVEAARIGDMGKGLSIIAQEFKVLAEEVQEIAKQAQADAVRMLPR